MEFYQGFASLKQVRGRRSSLLAILKYFPKRRLNCSMGRLSISRMLSSLRCETPPASRPFWLIHPDQLLRSFRQSKTWQIPHMQNWARSTYPHMRYNSSFWSNKIQVLHGDTLRCRFFQFLVKMRWYFHVRIIADVHMQVMIPRLFSDWFHFGFSYQPYPSCGWYSESLFPRWWWVVLTVPMYAFWLILI